MTKYIFTKGDKYVGMDNASGGYPYITDEPLKVKVWRSKTDALKYAAQFKESWQLREFYGLNMSLPI